MKISMTVFLACVAFLYSFGIVCIAEWGYFRLPDEVLYPIYPGIWVGEKIYFKVTNNMWICYAAGIGTMTLVGAVIGTIFDFLCGGRRSGGA